MPTSRRAFLAAQGALLGASILPGGLLSAVESRTPAMPPLDDWKRVRDQFRLSRDYLHFAGFYIASHPTPVRDALEAFRRALDENPFLVVEQGLFESEQQNLQSRVRAEAAAYLGGKPEEVALTQNTTTGLALVYHGLPLKPGQEVLTTAHDHIVHHEAIRFATERTPRDPALSAGICCFEVEKRTPDEVVDALLTRKVIASTSPYAVSYARLSASIFNTPEEVDRAVGAVRALVA